MREVTKSMLSYGWAMSVFGLQQMVNVITPGQGDATAKATQAFNNVTDATVQTFDCSMKQMFKTGDSMQKAMTDLVFSGFLSGGLDPNRWFNAGSETLRKMTDLGRDAVQQASNAAAGATAATGAGAPAPNSGPAGSSGGDWGPMPR